MWGLNHTANVYSDASNLYVRPTFNEGPVSDRRNTSRFPPAGYKFYILVFKFRHILLPLQSLEAPYLRYSLSPTELAKHWPPFSIPNILRPLSRAAFAHLYKACLLPL